MLTVGDESLSFDDARDRLEKYALAYDATILYFDFAGDPDGDIVASDGVMVGDIGRLTVINADLDGDDAARLLRMTVDWTVVARNARLEEADPDERDGLYSAMNLLWDQVTELEGIGKAKASKLLHIKRPFAFPIRDTDVTKTYSARHKKAHSWWRPIREDLIAGRADFDRLGESLRAADDESVRRAGRLPALRLLDILAWSRWH